MKFITPGVFRFLLAFVVVVHHNVDFLLIGHAAVYIFFVLSGYWIAKMYTEKYQYYQNSYTVFMTSRILRLLPVYYLVLFMTIIVGLIYNDILSNELLTHPDIIFSNLFLLGLSNSAHCILLPGWSLDIEIQFYLIAPLLLFFFQKVQHQKVVFALCMCVSLIYVFTVGEALLTVLNYLSFFVIGIGIFIWNIKSNKTIAYGLLFMAFIVYSMHFVIPELRAIFLSKTPHEILSLNYHESLNVLLTLLVIPYVTINVRMPGTMQYDKILSSMSYVIYLIHWTAIMIYSTYIVGMSTKEKAIPFLCYIVGSVFVSYVISITYDEYFEKKRRAYLKSRIKIS